MAGFLVVVGGTCMAIAASLAFRGDFQDAAGFAFCALALAIFAAAALLGSRGL